MMVVGRRCQAATGCSCGFGDLSYELTLRFGDRSTESKVWPCHFFEVRHAGPPLAMVCTRFVC
jgi:hypothetical protein